MTAEYPANDPRSQLVATSTGARAQGDDVLPFQHHQLGQSDPDEVTASGSRSWILRAQNVVVVWTDLVAGDALTRDDPDETMLLVLMGDGRVTVDAGDERAVLARLSIANVPPGRSRIVSDGDVRIVRLFSRSARDLVALSRNRELYDPAPASIAVHSAWPRPHDGERLRVYADLDEIEQSPGRMGRIFRNRHVMVNLLYPRVGPRDPKTLSPHDHDDFEQISLAYGGSYVHHIRAHWGKDRLQWREDEHVRSESPSVAIIPPPLIHTSEAVGEGSNQMVDIFAGPRADFSNRPGWVLNAGDYPMPEVVGK